MLSNFISDTRGSIAALTDGQKKLYKTAALICLVDKLKHDKNADIEKNFNKLKKMIIKLPKDESVGREYSKLFRQIQIDVEKQYGYIESGTLKLRSSIMGLFIGLGIGIGAGIYFGDMATALVLWGAIGVLFGFAAGINRENSDKNKKRMY